MMIRVIAKGRTIEVPARAGLALLTILSLLLMTCPGTEAAIERERRGVQWGLMPVFNYSSDTGANLGGSLRRFDYGDPSVAPFVSLWTAQVVYSSQGPRWGLVEYECTGLGPDGSWRLSSEIYLSTNDFQPYYGAGPDTLLDVPRARLGQYEFSANMTAFSNSLRKDFGEGLGLELGVTPLSFRYRPSRAGSAYEEDFGDSDIHLYSTRIHAGVVVERRDSEFIPSRGWYASAFVAWAPGFLGTAEGWGRSDVDARGYWPLLANRWLWLAAQGRYSFTSAGTPLTEKARLGSVGTLRGLPLGRYVSNQSLSLRTELRSIVIRKGIFGLPLKGGAGVFADTGKIGMDFAQLTSGRLHQAWGVSLFGSFFTDDFLGTADIGFSEGQRTVYFRLGHAF